MHDMTYIYSREYKEDIEYYPSDLFYSGTVALGCGMDTGRPYHLIFDEDGQLEEVKPLTEE